MPFVRRKRVKGRDYHYLVSNQRDGTKIRQTVIAYLGQCSTVDEAYSHWRQEAVSARKRQDKEQERYARQMVKKLAPYVE
jgi:hypothetical protein